MDTHTSSQETGTTHTHTLKTNTILTGFDFILINTTHPAKVGIRSGNPSDYEPESFKRFGCCQAVGEGGGGGHYIMTIMKCLTLEM